MRWIGATAVAMLAGCEPTGEADSAEPPVPADASTDASGAPNAAAAAWSWDEYRFATDITLSESPARVASQRTAAFVAPVDGPIEVDRRVRRAGPGGATLEAGEEWGRVAPERIALERRSVDGQRRQLELRELLFSALEQPRAELDALRDLENARRARDQLRLAVESRDDPLVREVFPDLPPDFGDEALDAAERLVEVLEERFRRSGDPESSVELIQLELARIDLEQAVLGLERLEERSALVMPFDGEVLLRREFDTVGGLFARAGDVIATARGGEVILQVEAGEALWLGIDPDRLAYVASVPGGGRVRAAFQRRETAEVRGLDTLVDRFVVPSNDEAARLRRLTGASIRGRLVASLGERSRLVPKLDLLLAFPSRFARGDWEAGVAAEWPGARVTGIGLTEVAVVPPPGDAEDVSGAAAP